MVRTYENETDDPRFQTRGDGTGHMVEMMNCADFKKEAADQAYGQCGKSGCEEDYRKIRAQMFHSYTDDAGY
jgi:hypothetical protein